MFVSFLCCQPLRWIGTVAGSAFDSVSLDHAGYIVTGLLMYPVLQKYVVKSVRHLMERSTKSCLLFGAIPTQRQASIQRERDMLDVQLRQAQTEFATLRQMQQNAAAYRHDMRHHIALLQGLASKGHIDEIREYLQTAQSDIDAITPTRFCENETVNLILSSFAAKAEQLKILLTIDAKLPDSLTFTDNELCSLLSNALENAIQASKNIPDSSKRVIRLRMYSKNNKLCIDIRNSYLLEPVFHQGLPVSKEPGHGYGTKSMAHIVEKHGGVCRFSVMDGWFVFQATA